MTTRTLLSGILMLAVSIQLSAQHTGWYTPVNENKPFVRWWWPGSAVDKEGLKYNLEEFAKAGIGGYEVTPIYGVQGNEAKDIDYLSPKWMDMYKYLVSESQRLGLECDMNNGTGWPFGGPQITPELAAQKMKVTPEAVTSEQTGQKVKRAAPGGEGWVMDHYNAEALKTYLKRFDDAFASSGARWPHTWFNDSYEVYGADWTPEFPKIFKERYGYDIDKYLEQNAASGNAQTGRRPQMPQGMQPGQMPLQAGQRGQMQPGTSPMMPQGMQPGQMPQAGRMQAAAPLNPAKLSNYDRAICDYRELLGNLLRENFIKPWIEWCHSHGALVRNQSHGSPANILDVYASVDIPECETYGRTKFTFDGLRQDPISRPNDGDPAALKIATSAAHLTGKKYTSCETLTWLTEHFRTSLSQCKPEIDKAFASGVNHIYFHGAPYSPKGAAFPGWLFYASINMSPTSGMWADAPALFKYIERCQAFLTAGEPDTDVLLYLPVYDAWSSSTQTPYMMFDIHGLSRTMPDAKAAMDKITAMGYQADYISDELLQTVKIDKPVIVPNCKMLPVETARRLVELKKQGIPVYFVDGVPTDVPGLHNLAARRSEFRKIARSFGKAVTLTKALSGCKAESITSKYGVDMLRRQNEDGGYNYFLTLLKNGSVNDYIGLAKKAESAVIFDPMTGESGKAQVRKAADGSAEIRIQLKPGQTLLVKTFPEDVTAPAWPYIASEGEAIPVDKAWNISFPKSDPAIEGNFFTDKPMDWTKLNNASAKVNFATALYSSAVEIADPSTADDWTLDLGDVRESARVVINGQEAGTVWAVPFRINIGKFLQPGVNLIDVYVTNLMSNRISQMDRDGVNWRIFKDANIAGVPGSPLSNGKSYADWATDPSGLCSTVNLIPIHYDLPDADAIIAQGRKVNDYFMKKYYDPGKVVPFPSRHKVYEGNIWTRSVYYEGLMAFNEVDPQEKYLQYTMDWGNRFHWNMGGGQTLTRNADNYCCSQSYIDMYRIVKDPAMIANVTKCLEGILSTDESDADWTWIDAIQMGMPALIKYGVTTGKPEYFEKAWKMYKWARDRFWNASDGLWWRDKTFCPPFTTPNGKNCYWSRGNGWVLAAYVRILNELPSNAAHRDVYEADFKAMCDALAKVQREDGTWNCSLGDPDDYPGPEATGTSLFVYGIAWGVRTGRLDEDTFRPIVVRAWNGLNRICIHDNGFIGYSQGSGKEPKGAQPLSYNRIPDFEDFGTGCFLLAASETARLAEE